MTKPDIYSQVDAYLEDKLLSRQNDPDFVIARQVKEDIPPIAVSALQGSFLNILTKSVGARRVLEIGTLAGYSTIWLARALPEDGRLVSLELHDRNADLATNHLTEAGVADKVTIMRGPAERSLNIMVNDGNAPFDLVFLDADKVNYPVYIDRVLHLVQPGSVIIADNVIRDGGLVDPENFDPAIRGLREFMDIVSENPKLTATTLQTVGSKGHDGFAMIRVES